MHRLTVVLLIGLAGCQEPLSVPADESGQPARTPSAADETAPGGKTRPGHQPLPLKRPTDDVRRVAKQLEQLGAIVRINDQGRIILVDLSFCSVTDTELVHLQGLTSLRQLVLRNTPITSAGLAHLAELTHLKILVLTGSLVTDAGLVHLQQLKGLTFLALNNTQITDAGIHQLKRALPKCNIDRI